MKATVNWLVIIAGIWLGLAAPVFADGSCNRPGNLTQNCNFDRFVDRSQGGVTRLVPEGWTAWVTMGNPAFDVDNHGSAPGAPALRIWCDGAPWTAGLYQQVPVTPGKWYEAKIDWAAPSRDVADIERRVGIDPTGGVDPASPRVVWGPPVSAVIAMPDLRAAAFTQSSTVTVFVWTHHPVSHGPDEVFLDAVTLAEDSSRAVPAPTPRPNTPTPTRRPQTRTSAAAQPTRTLVPTATPLPPTATATPVPTDTPVPTASPIPSPTPTWTPTHTPAPPTATPLPSRTPLPTIQVEAVALAVDDLSAGPVDQSGQARAGTATAAPVLLFVGAGALLGALTLAGVVVWLWMRGKGRPGRPEDQESEEQK